MPPDGSSATCPLRSGAGRMTMCVRETMRSWKKPGAARRRSFGATIVPTLPVWLALVEDVFEFG